MTLHSSSAGFNVNPGTICKIVHLSSIGIQSIRVQKLKLTFKTRSQSILTGTNVELCVLFYFVKLSLKNNHDLFLSLLNNHFNVQYITVKGGFKNLLKDSHMLVVNFLKSYRWCNGYRARVQCGRSWVRAPVGSNQKL